MVVQDGCGSEESIVAEPTLPWFSDCIGAVGYSGELSQEPLLCYSVQIIGFERENGFNGAKLASLSANTSKNKDRLKTSRTTTKKS